MEQAFLVGTNTSVSPGYRDVYVCVCVSAGACMAGKMSCVCGIRLYNKRLTMDARKEGRSYQETKLKAKERLSRFTVIMRRDFT